ncbi:MAG: WGR domain-containing protein [Candidatus Sericytochromatia bacterium]
MNKFYFECIEGSYKFYEIEVKDNTIYVNYGRIGEKGKSKLYSFESITEVESFLQKLVNQKQKKGYVTAMKGQRFWRPRSLNPRQLSIPFYEFKT